MHIEEGCSVSLVRECIWGQLIQGNEADGFPDGKVRGANMGPIWGREDPDGPHVGPMNFAIWVATDSCHRFYPYDFLISKNKIIGVANDELKPMLGLIPEDIFATYLQWVEKVTCISSQLHTNMSLIIDAKILWI